MAIDARQHEGILGVSCWFWGLVGNDEHNGAIKNLSNPHKKIK